MTAYNRTITLPRTTMDIGVVDRILGWFTLSRRERTERRILANLRRLDRRILDDMGSDPDAIYESGTSAWDDITTLRHPNLPTV
jgi:hypothetical protein